MTSLLKLFSSPKQPGLPRQVREKVDLEVKVEVEAERTHNVILPSGDTPEAEGGEHSGGCAVTC